MSADGRTTGEKARWSKRLNEAPGPVNLPERSDDDAVALTIWEAS